MHLYSEFLNFVALGTVTFEWISRRLDRITRTRMPRPRTSSHGVCYEETERGLRTNCGEYRPSSHDDKYYTKFGPTGSLSALSLQEGQYYRADRFYKQSRENQNKWRISILNHSDIKIDEHDSRLSILACFLWSCTVPFVSFFPYASATVWHYNFISLHISVLRSKSPKGKTKARKKSPNWWFYFISAAWVTPDP